MFKEFSFIGLLFIPLIFIISRKVLRERMPFLIIFSFAILISILSFFEMSNDKSTSPNFILLWFCPIYSLLLYRLMLIPFWARKRRDPKIPQRELFYSGDVSLFADKFFGFVFMLLSILLPMVLIIKLS
ncbi:RsiW-degrading membrane proteinase PrsW (M82 family) [Flavobacterium sp. CG_23.5]|nr:RsiW-degrading membrane proteinase PrsW (M82 family) [Flavobacterium sp. CG_9.10]MBP2283413.1 RsiW-degrading membrane proteinase PrsW (M82 family) [Flavobacterium sp. CG_23.5]